MNGDIDKLTRRQGHLRAAEMVGTILSWGNGVAIDYPRALAAYEIGAKGGEARCQFQVTKNAPNFPRF